MKCIIGPGRYMNGSANGHAGEPTYVLPTLAKRKYFSIYFGSICIKKNWRDRVRRLKFYPAALELIRHTRIDPQVRMNPNKPKELLYRFHGITANGKKFSVHIKEGLARHQKILISVYPE